MKFITFVKSFLQKVVHFVKICIINLTYLTIILIVSLVVLLYGILDITDNKRD